MGQQKWFCTRIQSGSKTALAALVLATGVNVSAAPVAKEKAMEPTVETGTKSLNTVPDIEAPRVVLNITGLRSNAGQVLIAIYNQGDGFPKKPDKALLKKSVRAERGNLKIDLGNLPPGDYAVALHHDEDEDGKMKFNFLGIPQEGFGFSGNAKILLGPPSFDRSKFHVDSAGVTECEVKMKYF